ncbi:hypothetical protein ACFX1X_028216 [Malus domestica]
MFFRSYGFSQVFLSDLNIIGGISIIVQYALMLSYTVVVEKHLISAKNMIYQSQDPTFQHRAGEHPLWGHFAELLQLGSVKQHGQCPFHNLVVFVSLFLTKQIRHFMDKAGLGKEAPEEVTRESLISISYSEPEKNLTSNLSSGKSNGEAIDADGEEKFRSELISISYAESPEVGGLPVTKGELKG